MSTFDGTGGVAVRQPHVVMIVANDVTIDTRVKKMAISLSESGLRVTVVGLSTTGKRVEGSLGRARVIRIPVVFALQRHVRSRRRTLPHLGYRSKDEYIAARFRKKVAEREAAAAVGRFRQRVVRAGLDFPGDLRGKLRLQLLWLPIRLRRGSVRLRGKLVRLREWSYRRRLDRQQHHAASRGLTLLWTRLSKGGWRRALPEIDDYELAFGPVIDELQPDVIHAHDVHLIGVAERAAARAHAARRHVQWVYDAHELVPGLPRYSPRVLAAYVALEQEYIRAADRVITVSEPIADLLQQSFALPRRPAVVMNIPIVSPVRQGDGPDVRTAAGLGPDATLLVYSGGLNQARGVETLIDALPLLEEAHLAIVCKGTSRYLRTLEQRAVELGCRHRLHLVPFVAPHEVPTYLSTATVGLITFLHAGNHEVAMPNKYFEYLYAGLPIVVSDVRAMADLTRDLRIGEVFAAGDAASLAAAVRCVLADRDRYAAPLRDRPEIFERFSWERQEETLRALYADLLGSTYSPRVPQPGAARSLEENPSASGGHRVLAIGPRNMAGQAWAWAKAVEREHQGVVTEVFALEKDSPLVFPADVRIPAASWKSLDWQLGQVRHVLDSYTHLLLEAGSGVFGTLCGGFFLGDLSILSTRDIRVGLVFHGSEVRDPRHHRKLEPDSPYADEHAELTIRHQDLVDRLLGMVDGFPGPRFVSTLDLLDYVPGAEWLPVVVDTKVWAEGPPILRRERPIVVHAPSNPVLKGSAPVDLAAEELSSLGLIDYRRMEGVPVEQFAETLREADIVLDQFALGDYGVLACQALAAGRLVVGHVSDRVRERLPAALPIVQARANEIRDILFSVLEDRARFQEVAASGVAYARSYHDGRYAALRLSTFLGLAEENV